MKDQWGSFKTADSFVKMCNDLWKLYQEAILSKAFLADSHLSFLGSSENLV